MTSCMHRTSIQAMKMAMLTARNLPDEIHQALRVRAAQHGHSTESGVREILDKAPARPVRFE